MAKQEFYICDHCGKKMNPMFDYDNITLSVAHRTYFLDLCQDCLDELCSQVENFKKRR